MLTLYWLNIGEGVLLVFTMPIWATLFAWPFLGTKPTTRSITALLFGRQAPPFCLVGTISHWAVGSFLASCLRLGPLYFLRSAPFSTDGPYLCRSWQR